MAIFRYLSHPQVEIDPTKDVTRWSLSEMGRQRAAICAQSPALRDTVRLLTSHETKAVETAYIIGEVLGLKPELVIGTGENDRSSTGFLPRRDFEATADQFFANPDLSIRGWETANDAQARIVSGIFGAIMSKGITGDVLCVGHGAVGTLLYCHLMNLSLSREHDQPDGGGNIFAFDMESDEVLHGWMPIETFSGLTGLTF